MLNPRIADLPESGFRRLDALIDGIAPKPGLAPIDMSVGDPRHPFPSFVIDILVREQALFGRYAPTGGTPEFRRAVAGWLARRYRLPEGLVDPDRHVLPVAGLRESMYLVAQVIVPRRKARRRPAVLMPNPFYHGYEAAALGAGAEPVFLAARRETGFLPDLDALDPALLERTAAFYLCSPANPQGVAASRDYLGRLVALARAHDFVLVLDECYADVYGGAPPAGVLEACAELGQGLANVLAFHSVSKRSNAPGLRSGFVAGDAEVLARFLKLRNAGGMAVPQPILAASTALWADDAHADASRALYREKFDLAGRILGNRFGYYRPDGGMFLWLETGDDEAVARELWREAAVRVMPGSYMGRGADNPGAGFLRVAVVHPFETTREGLERIAAAL